jgi:hypothetical protein
MQNHSSFPTTVGETLERKLQFSFDTFLQPLEGHQSWAMFFPQEWPCLQQNQGYNEES